MSDRIFVAGATGAIGRRLVPLLFEAGYSVVGATRSADRAAALVAMGAEAVVVDVYDPAALAHAVLAAHPDIVIHQLTDLPPSLAGLDAAQVREALGRNTRIRVEGTRNLVRAALAASVGRLIAQSGAWVYAPGPEPHAEDDPLDASAEGTRGVTVHGILTLERLTLESAPLVGTVLRYGMLYGPGTGRDAPPAPPAVHVDAAAWAAVRAVQTGQSGVFNIADPSPAVTVSRAERALGWAADFRGASSSADAP